MQFQDICSISGLRGRVWRFLEPFALRLVRNTFADVEDASSETALQDFIEAAQRLGGSAKILEAGTKQVATDRPTDCRWLFPDVPRSQYILSDIDPGENVDVIADLHDLPASWTSGFDIFIASAVFEHLERPWIAAKQIARILKPGGLCLITTHQTFPLHGYPSDFYRFSTEALALIFEDAGMRVMGAEYDKRSLIIPPATIVPRKLCGTWNRIWPSYLITRVFACKASSDP